MSILSHCVRQPQKLMPRNFIPDDSDPYRVRDGDSWESLTRQLSIRDAQSYDPWYLIRLNFPSLPQDKKQATLEVNWYLHEYVGCDALTPDRTNYKFTSSATPGIVYLPRKAVVCLEGIKARREAIMANTDGTFCIDDDGSAQVEKKPFYAIEKYEEVRANNAAIELAARAEGLDPELLKAIVWIETTHGYYDRIDPWNKTIRPMNVHAILWGDLGITKTTLKNRDYNIAAGAYILGQIWERTLDPTPEKVATLYNQLGAKTVNQYGRTVAHYMKVKPWLRKP
jgi:hypothetical protein